MPTQENTIKLLQGCLPNGQHVIQQDHPQDAYPMDNMALIEMSSMHYINMPKIVSTAHYVALKSILYW